MSKNQMQQKKSSQEENKEPVFIYNVGSNVIEYDGKGYYLSKILWGEGLQYKDVKDYIVE